jgi:Protein of unknown function (DUF3662)/FHA domain
VSILSDFEDRVGGALEAVFAGVFRSPVQPVELARALGKAMDDGRSVGVGKVYAPLGYTVALSEEDADNFGAFLTTLSGELATFLTDHARERHYHLISVPRVSFVTHDDLRLGRFRVSAELAAPEPVRTHTAEPEFANAPDEQFPDLRSSGPGNGLATVTVGDLALDVVLTGDRVIAGRLATSGIHLADSNASREHAAFVRQGGGWAIEDLDSTNGTMLNGVPVTRAVLVDGDVVEIGVTRLTYHEPGR